MADLNPKVVDYLLRNPGSTSIQYEEDEAAKKRLADLDAQSQHMADPAFQASLGQSTLDNQRAAREQSQIAAYAQAANQMGTLGGKTSSIGGLADVTDQAAKQAMINQAGVGQERKDIDETQAKRDKIREYLLGRRDLNTANAIKQADIQDKYTHDAAIDDKKFDRDRQLKQMEIDSAQSIARSKMANERASAAAKADSASLKPGKPPAKEQFDAAMYGKRLESSEAIFDKLASDGYDRSSRRSGIAAAITPDAFKSSELKQQEQAERNFVNAVLRRESGAAISPAEFANAEEQYFPRAGDPPEALAQKKQNRLQAMVGLKASSGNAWDQIPNVALPKTDEAPESGTAMAATTESAPRKQYNAKLNKTRLIYPDGRVEVLDGQQ